MGAVVAALRPAPGQLLLCDMGFLNALSLGWVTPRRAALAAGCLIASWFLYFAGWGLRAEFTHDDLMNCHRAVFYPLPRLLGDILVWFRPSDLYRPLPELAYRLFFNLSQFNLLPFRAFLTGVMALNIFLLYAFTRRLTSSRETGALAALLGSVHINISGYYFNTGQIYDIFCYSFYFSALIYYSKIRQQGSPLNWRQTLIFCGLYALALDSKELAVSLPLVVAAWELLHAAPGWRLRAWTGYLRRELLPLGAAALMTAAYVPGRVMAQGGIAAAPGYKMDVSPAAYLERTGFYLGELFYAPGWFDERRTLAFALLLLAGALWTRSRALTVCWILFFGGILPMAFIAPRGLTAVWIPAAGLLIYGAYCAARLREAALRRLGGQRWRPVAQAALFLLAGYAMIQVHTGIRILWASWQPEYASIRNLRESLIRCCPTMPRRASMLFVTDPLNETYSTVFLVQLLYRDPDSRVDQLFRFERPLAPAEIASYDYIFDFVDGKLIRLDPIEYARRAARAAQTGPR